MLLDKDHVDLNKTENSSFSSGIKNAFSKLFKRKSSKNNDLENINDSAMTQKTFDLSMMSKQDSKNTSETNSDSQFIKIEDETAELPGT
jgi:hypothetical protein